MSEPNKYREWILETIDSLRSRKARPDLDRISRMVQRRHGSDPDRTRTELEKLIQEQTVLKVSYKGSISYRNAAKVQRRSRKRSESGGGPDATRERSEPEHPSSNAGDSAHSSTDPEEGETEPEPRADDLEPQSGSSPGSGHGRLGCGVATSRADCRGCEEETASGRWGAGVSRGAAAGEPGDGSQNKPVSRSQTSAGGDGQAQVWSELRTKPTHRQGGCERREPTAHSDRTQRGGGSAGRGHVKPLDLKEILGYLSSQERLSEEKLTRGKVKAVMEREVERGRLRRTRCGDITLPLRGVGGPPQPAGPSADGLGRSAPRDERAGSESSPACPDSTPMETAGGEDEEEKDGDADPRSSDEDRELSPVAMTTEAGHTEKSGEDAGFQGELKAGSPKQQRQDGEPAPLSEMSELDFPPGSRSPPADRASWSECNGASSEKGAFSSDHLSCTQRDDLNLTSSSFHNVEYKTEVGASSCMLTPTASPRDPGIPEERGVSDGSGGLMKFDNTRVSPVDWTVSDVVSYFTAVGFPEQAAAFRTQEIDGKSLLLMQRNDVLTGLSIKLGPALKIYERHVKVLQNTHFEENDCYQDPKDTLRLLC